MGPHYMAYSFAILVVAIPGCIMNATAGPAIIEVNMPLRMSFDVNSTYVLKVEGIPMAVKYVLFQVHTQATNVTLSLRPQWAMGYSTRGNNVGVIAKLKAMEEEVAVYINATQPVTAVVLATPYEYKAPVPGGCNQVFPLTLDPRIRIVGDSNQMHVSFQYANFGTRRDGADPRCEVAGYQLRMTYELYQYFLPARDWSEEVYMQTITKLITLTSLRDNAKKVKMIEYDKGHTSVGFAAYSGQGVMYAVVVTETYLDNTTHTATYVPTTTYTCAFSTGVGCVSLDDLPAQVLATILGSIGLLICLFGHRLFKTSMFTLGTLAFGIVTYILVARFTSFDPNMLLILGSVGGVAGGLLCLLFWCMVGVPVLSMVIPGLVLGYIFASLVFNLTPLGQLDVFDSEFNYGMAFTCAVLVLPVVLLAFTKKLSFVCCTVIGSFLVMMAIDAYLFSNISYLVLNSIRKGAIPGYMSTLTTLPLQLTGILLLIGWVCLTLVGLILQSYRERDRPDFPPCPYESYQERRHRRRQMAELAGERDMNHERAPLLGGQPNRQFYRGGRRPSAPQFQETPPNDRNPPTYNSMIDPL